MDTVSLFSGIGGLDLGFSNTGFKVIWANDNSSSTFKTFKHNNKGVKFDTRDITKIPSSDIPDCDVIIGGPPCQAWSAAGSNRGANDPRGKLFYEYLRVIGDKKPKIFVAENVEGILRKTHQKEFEKILDQLESHGYKVFYQKLNASDYEVPQDRKRVIIVGVRLDISTKFSYPVPSTKKVCLSDAIYDLRNEKLIAVKRSGIKYPDMDNTYLDDSWSSQFMSRNRVRSWSDPSFTIPATGRQVPLHPQAPKMIKIGQDKYEFVDDQTARFNGDNLYRRMTIRECARIQTFPDNYELFFDTIDNGYKILGNAVPVKLAEHIAKSVKNVLTAKTVKKSVTIKLKK